MKVMTIMSGKNVWQIRVTVSCTSINDINLILTEIYQQLSFDMYLSIRQSDLTMSDPNHSFHWEELSFGHIFSAEDLQNSQVELKKQAEETARAAALVDLLEDKARYFALGVTSPVTRKKPVSHSNNKNLGKAKSDTAVKHSPVRVASEDKTDWVIPEICRYKRHGPPDQRPAEFNMYPTEKDKTTSNLAVDLPPNIQHQFGTNICRSVLADKGCTDQTLDEIKSHSQSHSQRTQALKKERGKQACPYNPANLQYDSLGNTLRQNVFPGDSSYHNEGSLTHSVYTGEVFKKRVTDPDQHRHRRDELSKLTLCELSYPISSPPPHHLDYRASQTTWGERGGGGHSKF